MIWTSRFRWTVTPLASPLSVSSPVALMSSSKVGLLDGRWRSERSVASGETRVMPLAVADPRARVARERTRVKDQYRATWNTGSDVETPRGIVLATPSIEGATMSNHFSAAMLKFPGDDPRLDLTDLFVFASPESSGKTVLIFDVNPLMTGADFDPDAVYRINVDNDGDLQADVAFSFVFSESNGGTQTGTLYYATGSEARQPEPAGEVLIEGTPVGFDATAEPVEAGPCRFFIGVRSDPFFADGEGAFHDFHFTGEDTFAGKNVLSMALEVPDEMLGAGPEIGSG